MFSILISEFLRIFFYFFHAFFFIKNKVCLPIDRLNIEDVFVKSLSNQIMINKYMFCRTLKCRLFVYFVIFHAFVSIC